VDPDDAWSGPDDDLATELEAMWQAPEAVAPSVETVTVWPLPDGAQSQAPYPALPSPAPACAPGSSWRHAGRSWAQAADRARGGSGWFRRASAEVVRLRRRAGAARQTARALEGLAARGYVVLHDRVIAGTGEVLDHVVAGPPGLLLIAAHPVTRLTWDECGVLFDAGEPFPPEVTALRWRSQQLLEAVIGQLPGWQLACYPAICLVGAADWSAWVGEPASMVTPAQLSWWASTLPGPLAALHVADLALALTTICPPATA
jgi:hypothetical protein